MAKTRASRAAELMTHLRRGPSFTGLGHPRGGALTPQEAERQFKLWAESWIIPEVCSLIPELHAPRETKR